MDDRKKCENIEVDNQESRITWHQNFLPGIWNISISSSSFMDKTQKPAITTNDESIMFKHLKWTAIGTIRFKYNWNEANEQGTNRSDLLMINSYQGSTPSKQSMIAKSLQPNEQENT